MFLISRKTMIVVDPPKVCALSPPLILCELVNQIEKNIGPPNVPKSSCLTTNLIEEKCISQNPEDMRETHRHNLLAVIPSTIPHQLFPPHTIFFLTRQNTSQLSSLKMRRSNICFVVQTRRSTDCDALKL